MSEKTKDGIYQDSFMAVSSKPWTKAKRIIGRNPEDIWPSLCVINLVGEISIHCLTTQTNTKQEVGLKETPSAKAINAQPSNRRIREAQNKDISTQIHQAQRAVTKLIDTGLTVIGVQITDNRPQVEIQYQTKCENLNGVSCGLQNVNGEIVEMMISQFHHCDVIWIQPEYVNQLKGIKGMSNG